MTLTEQWKKGELQNNWYYIRTTNGIEKWEYIKQSHGFGYYETEWVLEVLAPVPSYEKWQELKEDCRVLKEALTNHKEIRNGLYSECDKLERENQQLKELLKQWVHFYPIVLYEYEDTLKTRDIIELFEKTINAIGEKK